jgi:hypothetical protein
MASGDASRPVRLTWRSEFPIEITLKGIICKYEYSSLINKVFVETNFVSKQ